MNNTKRIGIFGGTFNPVHKGHLEAIRAVAQAFDFEETYLIPAAIPPHKSGHEIASASDRMEMLRLALSECSCLKKPVRISDIELRRSGPSYTIDTVRHFKSLMPDMEICFILGLDAFLEINTWKSFNLLFGLVSFIVMNRAGFGVSFGRLNCRSVESCGDRETAFFKKIALFLKKEISEAYEFSEERQCHIHPEKQPVYPFDADLPDISSTEIRTRIKEGRSIQFLTPETVASFIQKKGLFQ